MTRKKAKTTVNSSVHRMNTLLADTHTHTFQDSIHILKLAPAGHLRVRRDLDASSNLTPTNQPGRM